MIYKGSRYSNTQAKINEQGEKILKQRKSFNYNLDKATKHIFTETDSLPLLAYNNYGSSKLWWAILEANPGYKTELDIAIGDVIMIPSKKEVLRIYG